MSFPRYPAYKPSGVEWLGEVPEHWDISALKRSFRVIGGSTPKTDTEEYWDGDIPWITPTDLSNRTTFEIRESARSITEEGLSSCGTTLVPAGSIILSTRAPIGSIGIAARPLCTNQGCKSLVSKSQHKSRFIAHLLSIATEELNIRGRGSTFVEISGDELGAFLIPCPPSNEQLTITNFLDRETAKIDALIAEQQRLIELLQEKRQAVISHAVTKGLNPDASMKDSGVEWLGEVPEHWEVRRVKSIGQGVIGLTYSPNDITDEANGIPVLRASNIQNGLLDWEDTVFVSGEPNPELLIQSGDILICARSGSRDLIGKNILISKDVANERITFGAFMTVLRCADPSFLRWVLSSMVFRAQSGAYMSTTINQLTQSTLMNTIIAFPPAEERQDIHKYLESSTRKMDHLSMEASRSMLLLQERRSALISAAVTGQIDVRVLVPEAEAA